MTPKRSISYCKKGDVRFNLKIEGDKTSNLQIYLIFSFDGRRLRYYTGKRINLNQWDKSNQRVKSNADASLSLNGFLKSLANLVSSEYNNARAIGINPSVEYLREKLLAFNFRNNEDFLERFQEFMDRCKNEKAKGTIKKYRNTKSHLKNFAQYSGYKLDFDSINMKFEEKFKDYLINQKKQNDTTVAKNFKVLKVLMNYALNAGITKNMDFIKFKAREREGEIIFLSWDQLMKLYTCDKVTEPRHFIVRDIFCFGCFTGLRFSDIMNLKLENIRDGNIYITTIKNKKTSIIPFNKYSEKIVNKYMDGKTDGFLFPQISNLKMNIYLKELGVIAELNDKVTLIDFKGSQRYEESKVLHEVLTTHIARKTFITNALGRGMPSEVIMDITGHATHKVFERYYKIVDEQRKREMEKAFN